MTNDQEKVPSLGLSLIPIVFLVTLLVVNILIFKDDATGGANQIALLLSGVVCAVLGSKFLNIPYKKMEEAAIKSIGLAMQANIILLLVGSIIGIWILSGIVPTMIYYGVQIISPSVFLPVTCILCAIVSLATGSSWSTGGTVGIALIGIGTTLGIPVGMVAGAIISGAYFGDKMSPLSDTTNLAPAMVGTDLFTHIKHMLYSTVPAIILALIGFTILGLFNSGSGGNITEIENVITVIDKTFNIGIYLLLVPAAVLFMVAKKVPALPALFGGLMLGVLAAIIFQQDTMSAFVGEPISAKTIYKSVLVTAYNGFNIETGNKLIDSLFSRGGMSGMLNTVWLILMAMI
ncbi:MAG: NhaC family Na+:H+ antiporter, partial [Thermoproteota archaeon]